MEFFLHCVGYMIILSHTIQAWIIFLACAIIYDIFIPKTSVVLVLFIIHLNPKQCDFPTVSFHLENL